MVGNASGADVEAFGVSQEEHGQEQEENQTTWSREGRLQESLVLDSKTAT
jgi:hypothetical protein